MERTEDVCECSYLNTVFTSHLQNQLLKTPLASRNVSKAWTNGESSPACHSICPSASLFLWSCSLAVILQVNSFITGWTVSVIRDLKSNEMNVHNVPPNAAVQEEEEYQGLSVVLEASLILNSQTGDAVAEGGR